MVNNIVHVHLLVYISYRFNAMYLVIVNIIKVKNKFPSFFFYARAIYEYVFYALYSQCVPVVAQVYIFCYFVTPLGDPWLP